MPPVQATIYLLYVATTTSPMINCSMELSLTLRLIDLHGISIPETYCLKLEYQPGF